MSGKLRPHPSPVNFFIGSHVRKHTASLLHTKYHHITSWTLSLLQLSVCCMGGSPGQVSENPVTYERRKEGLENELCYDYNHELCSFSKLSVTSPTSQLILILQPFRHFTYVTAHSPTLPSLYLRHSSFSNPSVASPTSQLIFQPFRCFTYATVHSPTLLSLLLRHKLFT